MKQVHSAVLAPATLALTLAAWITGEFNVALAAELSSKYIRQSTSADTVIVFVHGIMGDGLSTWTNQNAYWPAAEASASGVATPAPKPRTIDIIKQPSLLRQ